jgi:hypothetical protein
MLESNGEEEPLRACDSGGGNIVEIYVQDGSGECRSLIASGRPSRTLSKCHDHFTAHGVCVDCTRATGRTIWAS